MANERLAKALQGLDLNDIRIDAEGRLVIDNPEVANRVREIGTLRPAAADRSDTNIICCGNSKCGASSLGDFLDRVVRPQVSTVGIG